MSETFSAADLENAIQAAKIDERRNCAELARAWLKDWGSELLATSDSYLDAMSSGKVNNRRISRDMAASFAKQFKERGEAVFDTGDILATHMLSLPSSKSA